MKTFFVFVLSVPFLLYAQKVGKVLSFGIDYGALNGITAIDDNGSALNSSIGISANLDMYGRRNTRVTLGYYYIRENKNFIEYVGWSLFTPTSRRVHANSNIHIPFIGLSRFKTYENESQVGFSLKLGAPLYTDLNYFSEGVDVNSEFDKLKHWSAIFTEYGIYGQFSTKIDKLFVKTELVLGFAGVGFGYTSLGYYGVRAGIVYQY
ncbi:MAG: hypothetical protein ACI9JN_001223 [Bacteroidia bacterium]|jgi:hypothetical protein